MKVAAVGAGRMGRGIALAFAYSGVSIILVDAKLREAEEFSSLARDAEAEISDGLGFILRAGLMDETAVEKARARISILSRAEAGSAITSADIIFEGVPELLDAKREALAFISDHARADAIIASTTSTISADILAGFVVDPGRFLNAHWLNPAHLMPLVEVSPCAETRANVQMRLIELLRGVGKVPVVCKSSPGFIVARIQALAMNEAARMVEEGVATAEDIDLAIRVGFGLRFSVLGLLEFIDWGGGDILYHASAFLSSEIDPSRFAAPEIIGRNMAESRRGLRDGRGFYDYATIDVASFREVRLNSFVDMLRMRDLLPRTAADRE